MPNPPLEFHIPGLAEPLRMMHVPGGRFIMGASTDPKHPNYDPDAQSDERPHPVILDDFYLAEYPVTQDVWEAVMGNNPSDFKKNGARRPVENVSWFDAAVFCNRLSVEHDRRPCYRTSAGAVFGRYKNDHWNLPNAGDVALDLQADGFRLPTEAEWELAARGGPLAASELPAWYAGSDLLEQVGWYADNSGDGTRPVGLLLPNSLGLYDLSGNVWEWCEDWFESNYPEQEEKNPRGLKKAGIRVYRGGSWGSYRVYCRTACRNHYGPGHRFNYYGFRPSLQSVSQPPSSH